MPPPSILNDGTAFFPNVIKDQTFQRTGVLTRTEGRRSWGVADPRRHVMTIWEKSVQNFVVAALGRNATLISNGPFLVYVGGGKKWSYFKYTVHSGFAKLSTALSAFGQGPEVVRDTAKKIADAEVRIRRSYFTSKESEGFIFGTSESITHKAQKEARPRAHYFGRDGGRSFADYKVARGDPFQMTEVIGGLFRSVDNYVAKDQQGQAAQAGAWGLAPITAAPATQKQQMESHGLSAAVSACDAVIEAGGSNVTPYGPRMAGTPMAGLIIAYFGGGSPPIFANELAAVLVKEAVRVDGNSSILLAQGGTALQGVPMIGIKRDYNRYGYMFKPG